MTTRIGTLKDAEKVIKTLQKENTNLQNDRDWFEDAWIKLSDQCESEHLDIDKELKKCNKKLNEYGKELEKCKGEYSKLLRDYNVLATDYAFKTRTIAQTKNSIYRKRKIKKSKF